MPYSEIVAVMPFLVVAVGIDNMFLMIAAIRRTSRCLPVTERMAECMSDAAVAILITATTDALSFGVGAITTLPAVHIFCVYTGVAISFAFVYQITFFAALLAVFTKLEEDGRNTVCGLKTLPESELKIATWSQRVFNLGSKPDPLQGNDIKEAAISGFFRDWYAPLLMNRVIRGIALLWYIIYLIFAYYGVTQIKVVVNNAPDLRNVTARHRIQAMIGDFATTRHSIGMEAVQFWMNDMESYYRDTLDMKIIDGAFYSMLRHWLASKHNNPWAEDLYWGDEKDGSATLKSFRVNNSYAKINEKGMGEASDQRKGCRVDKSLRPRSRRSLCVVQNIIIALLCMIIIAFVLIPQPMCAFWVALACASIDFGVVGYMTLWGVNLDAISMITIIMSIGFSVDYAAHITYGYVVSEALNPSDKVRDALASLGWPLCQDAISMITIIMSIGFSVDYAAHITYGYVVSEALNPSDKVRDALTSLGWPLCQGALSTIIAVSVLADVPAYMIITFFKTGALSTIIAVSVLADVPAYMIITFFKTFLQGNQALQKTPAIAKASATIEAGARWPPSAIHGMITPSLQIFESPEVTYPSPPYAPPPTVEQLTSPTIHNRSRTSVKSPEHLE
ncbi:patched family protein [Teladorsagia circumcincta]|uniref:Patched family protein n=1 Tax=Teladorsagia circumcincta TaxID=45464 RepID=A0A2G9UES7_TELCI|nr:patched family protein [Teladorsagia circumcincta]